MRGIFRRLVRCSILVCLGLVLGVGVLPGLTQPDQRPDQLHRTLDDSATGTDSLLGQSNALTMGGHYRQACETTLMAIGLAEPSCNFREPGAMTAVMAVLETESDAAMRLLKLTTLGNVLRLNGYLPQAQELLESGVTLAQTIDQPGLYAKTLLSLGKVRQLRYRRMIQLYAQTQDPIDQRESLDFALDALAAYGSAASLAQETQEIPLQVQIAAQRLDLLTHLQRRVTLFGQVDQTVLRSIVPQIRAQLQTVRTFDLEGVPPSRDLIDAQVRLARSLITLWEMPEVMQTAAIAPHHILPWLYQAQAAAIALQDPALESQTWGTLGHLYEVWNKQTPLETGQPPEHWQQAQTATQTALDLAQSLQAPHLTYQWSWQLGRLYHNAPDTALSHYQTTVDTLENVRRDLLTFNPEVRFDLRETIKPLYQEFIQLLLEKNAGTPSQANLQQAIREIDELQLAQLEDFLSCDLTPQLALHEEPTDSKAAIIYPILLPDQLDIVVKFPNTEALQFYRTPLATSDLVQALDSLRQQVERPYFTQQFFDQSQQIYDWLIRPMETAFTENSIETLVFVADGALGHVPMAVLHDGQQFLIEKYALALTPSLRLSAAQPLADTNLQAVAFGLSETRPDFPPHQGFAPLENVETELTIIQDQLSSQNYLNQQFTRKLLQERVHNQSSPVVHLATHGQFSSDPDNTFLLAWDQRITLADVRRLLGDRTAQTPIELLVLSACETATGDSQATMGLAGVAVQSGARSTIASLWSVDDVATTELMGYLYQALSTPSNRDTRAQALRQAQLALLHNPNFRAPTYWAAFVLVGNWL